MMHMNTIVPLSATLCAGVLQAAPLKLDERPAGDGDWGYRPAAGAVSAVTPPRFCWRPQKGIVSWEIECGLGKDFKAVAYRAEGVAFNVHCPPRVLAPGTYTWRYRGVDADGNATGWSRPRTFRIAADAVEMPLPARAELLARIPKSHPRLFLRPEQLDGLRALAKGPLKDQFDKLVTQCDKLLSNPPPTDLPVSRLFRGTGQAYLNTSLTDAKDSVQVVFKSSPLGTPSHGYEANNSFLLWAYGQRLLIRSGYRDSYGSEHHRKWMWSTRSVNNITVNGQGQAPRSFEAKGRITAFKTTPSLDIVVGEAGGAYKAFTGKKKRKASDPLLERFTRAVIFVKPELVIVYDRLVAPKPSRFDYWLHAIEKFDAPNQHAVKAQAKDVVCDIDFLAPDGLRFTQTNEYDPNPRPRIKLREWHLTATPPDKRKTVEFVALYRPHRAADALPQEAELTAIKGGYVLRARLSDGEVVALLPTDSAATLSSHGLEGRGGISVQRRGPSGAVIETLKGH